MREKVEQTKFNFSRATNRSLRKWKLLSRKLAYMLRKVELQKNGKSANSTNSQKVTGSSSRSVSILWP